MRCQTKQDLLESQTVQSPLILVAADGISQVVVSVGRVAIILGILKLNYGCRIIICIVDYVDSDEYFVMLD